MNPHYHKRGAKVSYYDPTGEKKEFNKLKNCNFFPNIKQACMNADLIILHTEWDEFKSLDYNKIVKNKKFILYDLRNLYSLDEMKRKKVKYFSIGRPSFNQLQK